VQLVDVPAILADAMLIGESTKIDMNSIELDANPGWHRDPP
jgi:hypothetical protein